MKYIFLILTMTLISSQNIFMKQYNLRSAKRNAFMYACISSFSAMLFFILSAGFKLNFNIELLPYSLGFAASYVSATVCFNLAIAKGSLSMSALASSYSMLIPTIYGIVFLKEPIRVSVYIGIVLLLVGIYLINWKKENRCFSFIWLLYVAVLFLGNGFCSTIQKMQQVRFDGGYKSEFMIIALAISFAALGFLVLTQRKEDKKEMLKDVMRYAPFGGLANGILNLLVMYLSATLPNAILFPLMSGGGIVITFLFSLLKYKEKFSNVRLVGYLFGIAAIIFLNI